MKWRAKTSNVLSTFSPGILQVLVDPLYGPPSHVLVALVGTLPIVVDNPFVQSDRTPLVMLLMMRAFVRIIAARVPRRKLRRGQIPQRPVRPVVVVVFSR